ncbi:MAG: hypothetical protein ACRDHM_11635 [Actinomycetota bacterium]
MHATEPSVRLGRHQLRNMLLIALAVPALIVGSAGDAFAAGGPLVLMGIDAEDSFGGTGQHGPVSSYGDVFDSMLANTSNGGDGILVIGGGKDPSDHVTLFWNALGVDTGETITYVNGGSITGKSFAGFQILAVVSSVTETPSGGITNFENDKLVARKQDVVEFVNGGGGLFGLSQANLSQPYGYLDDVGDFTFEFPPQYNNIEPTTEGLAIGVTNALDVCCWHDEYITFPSYLDVLAYNDDTGDDPAAIGGLQVVITSPVEGRMNGGGELRNSNRVTHGFELHCDAAELPNDLEVNWGRNRFHLETLDTADCSDDALIAPENPNAPFDTFEGTGTGRCNGNPADIDFRLTDNGEPQSDYAEFHISGGCTLDRAGILRSGNHQALPS